jgi:WXXGXW repeat (2 copies)
MLPPRNVTTTTMRSQEDDGIMKLNRSVLVTVTMMIGAMAMVACSKPDSSTDSSDTTADAPPDDTATAAPPAPEAETPGPAPSPGETWIQGSWKSDHGKFAWTKGRWEAGKAGQTLQQARWVQANGHWEHHPAHWVGGGKAAPAPAHPAERPGEHPAEKPGEKPGEKR